jgi:hypothetical protein
MSRRIYTAAEAKALREAATPGPWFTSGDCQTGGLDYLTVEVPIGPTENVSAAVLASIRRYGRHKNMAEGNAAILAAAPDLCLTVEALEAERDRLARILAWDAGFCDRLSEAMAQAESEAWQNMDNHPLHRSYAIRDGATEPAGEE